MTIKLTMPDSPPDLRPKIIVFGVGGAGCNAVNNMIRASIEGVECVVANTDSQALTQSEADRKIQLGMNITQGLGAGSRPEIGRAAAEEGLDDIISHLQGGHMAFITAGLGGGTGTGASPVIARTAREHGILTVGVVTKPFHFEGAHRMRIAEAGLQELQDVVDTLIVIPNQNLFRVANEKTTFADAFKMADEVLHSGVRGITDLMVMPGLINLDFADIRTVMGEMGKAMMGAGEADGENRAVEAAEAAISNPLLDDVSMAGARGLLINISGGPDLTLYEVDEAANRVRDEVDPGANIIFGSTFDENLDGHMRVSVFATGIDSEAMARPAPVEVSVMKPQQSRAIQPEPLEELAQEIAPPSAPEAPPEPMAPAATAASPAMAMAPDGLGPDRLTADGRADATDQTDMFAAEKALDPDAIMVAGPANQRPPMTAEAEAPTRSLALKVIPREIGAAEAAPAPVEPDAATPEPAQRKEPIFGFLRGRKKAAEEEPADANVAPIRPAQRPAARPEPAQPSQPAPAAHKEDASVHVLEPATTAAAPAKPAARPAQPAAAHPAREAGREPDSASSDDDLLEIPAFLRRQAN